MMRQKDLFLDILKLHLKDWSIFNIADVYQVAESPMSFHYPCNNHIKDKIRELLQVLRDEKIIFFHDRGVYGWVTYPIS
tara:strand:- start:80 stop:316 length:237 start_codon:yes stop_codon:yes gene_type:complete